MNAFWSDGLVNLASPARNELYSWAAARETFRPSKLVQEWMQAHPGAAGDKPGEAMRAALELQSLGTACVDASGDEALRLPGPVRMNVLRDLGPQAAAAVLSAVAQESLTLTERLFRDLLENKAVALDSANRPQLIALAEALRWASAAGIKAQLTEDEVLRHLARHDFLEALGGDDLHRFVGRAGLRRRLGEIWAKPGEPFRSVLVEGPGGIGKSLGIARFIADLLESGDAAVRPDAVFHLDFDRASLQRANTVLVTQDIIRQAARWAPTDVEALEELSHRIGSSAGPDALSYQVRNVDHRSRNIPGTLHQLSDILRKGRPGRFVFFADSFEQVEQLDDFASQAVNEVCNLLARSCERVMLIYAGRAFMQPKAFSERAPLHLREFSAGEADTYLMNEADRQGMKIGKDVTRKIRDIVGKTPLALRLAVGLLEQGEGELNPQDWERVTAESPELIQAAVYDRLLRRLKDPLLKQLALPSLLLRRITAPVIEAVLAKPCKLQLQKDAPAALLERCQKEWRLFVPLQEDGAAGNGPVVRHRPDVRASLLPNLERALGPEIVRAVNENAVAYYLSGSSLVFRTEELYHRLRLGQPRSELDSRWDDAAGAPLRASLSEFPPASRSYLRSRFGSASREGFAGAAFAEPLPALPGAGSAGSAVDEFRMYARKAFQSGEPVEVLLKDLESRRPGETTGELADVYAATLMRSGQHDRLLQFAREVASGHSGPSDPSVVTTVLTLAAGLLEGKSLLSEAQLFWIQGLRTAEALAPAELLPCLVGSARVRRKLDKGADARAAEIDRAAKLVELSDLRQRTGLARETSAELGELLTQPNTRSAQNLLSLMAYVFEMNEAFPSTLENPARAREIGLRLFDKEIDHVRALNSLLISSFFSGDIELIRKTVEVMREEVDWSLRVAAAPPAVSAAIASKPGLEWKPQGSDR